MPVFNETAITLATSLLLTGISMPATAKDISPSQATYALNFDGKTGTATRTLSKNVDTFTYKVTARAAGVATATQSSTVRLSGNNIVPSNASTSYKVAGVGRTHTIKFNGKQAVSSYKGKNTTIATPNGAYDELSLELQIRQELLNNKFSGNYVLIKKTDSEPTIFRKAGNTTISVPAGTFQTVRIDRVHSDKNRSTSFWLAPSLDYLPVKVSQTNDGKTIAMQLTKIN